MVLFLWYFNVIIGLLLLLVIDIICLLVLCLYCYVGLLGNFGLVFVMVFGIFV